LGKTDVGQRPSQKRQIVVPVRPVAGLPDISVITAIYAEIIVCILRKRKPFTAFYAEICMFISAYA
jgi:hypothetical protein